MLVVAVRVDMEVMDGPHLSTCHHSGQLSILCQLILCRCLHTIYIPCLNFDVAYKNNSPSFSAYLRNLLQQESFSKDKSKQFFKPLPLTGIKLIEII